VDSGHPLEAFEIGETATLIHDGVVIEQGFQADGLISRILAKYSRPAITSRVIPRPLRTCPGPGRPAGLDLLGQVSGALPHMVSRPCSSMSMLTFALRVVDDQEIQFT